MKKSTIRVDVTLDEQKIPETISWNATDSTAEDPNPAKAMMLNFWDGRDKSAMRIDLWTREMMVDEMVDFYFQTLMGMADTLGRSTGQKQLVEDLQHFAKDFFRKFRESQQQAG